MPTSMRCDPAQDGQRARLISQSHESAKKESHEKAREAKEAKSSDTGRPH
jgi:hypothetical protein